MDHTVDGRTGRSRRSTAGTWILLVALASCDRPSPSANTPRPLADQAGLTEVALPEAGRIVAGQTIYVPACSHVYTADGAQPLNLATSLFVRNPDPGQPMMVARVGYFDSGGKLVRELLRSPVRVAPLASAEFFIKEGDVTGGASPCFLVEWVAEQPVADPIAESIMIGTAGTQGISFTGQGRVVRSRRP